MKEGYLKEHWIAILITLAIGIAYFTTWEILWLVVFVVFAAAAIYNYRSYDPEESKAEQWFNNLQTYEKLKLHKNAHKILKGEE